MVIAYIFWGGIYAIISGGKIITILANTVAGHYHMWFIPMIIGLYICVPILHKIIESEELTKYFLIVSFLFSFLLPEIVQLVNDFGEEPYKEIVNIFSQILKNMNFYFVLGYTSYFIGGFYLNKLDLNKSSRYLVYLFGIFGFISTIILDALLAVKTQKPVGRYYDNFTVNVLMQSISIFVWVKYNAMNLKKLSAIMCRLSQYSFGAYLIHALIIEQLNSQFGLNTLSFNPIISVPIIAIVVFVLSFLMSALLNQIPVLNKYIV